MKLNRKIAALVGVSVILGACGNSATAISAPSTSVVSNNIGSTSTTVANGARGALPGATGTIAQVNGSTLEVQNPNTGQTTVTFTSSTVLTKTIPASASALVAGVCINAVGTPTSPSSSSTSTSLFGRPVTATTVTISQSVSGSCAVAGGGGFGGGRRFSAGGSGATRGSGFPGGANFATASGVVASVSNGLAQVTATNRSTGSTVTIPVTLTPTTTFLENTTATQADLVVGECARAIGPMNSIGAVAATRIAISTPTANGCLTGRRFGFGAPQGGNLG